MTAALDCDFGWTLGVVFRAYVEAANTVLGNVPGGPRGYQVLAAAAETEPASQGVLAARLGIDKTVMTYLLDDLESAGLVARRSDPGDRRHKQIVATRLGRSTWTKTRRALARAEDHVLAPLEADERAALRDLLQRLAARAPSADPVTDTCRIVQDVGQRA